MSRLKAKHKLQNGKYTIVDCLGQGGFGITYLAEQTNLGRNVAIKEFFLKEHCNRDADTSCVTIPSEGSYELVNRFKEKFIKEAKTIATLNHPHIIKIFDVFEENNTAYFVMDYVDNGNLNIMTTDHPLEENVALRYIQQIGNALDYLHNRNILHLDIKPSNILINNKSEAVLIDFGISKKYDDVGDETSSTPVGISRGYAPLEQYNNGVKKFTPATDIYSLGATLYQMLIGKRPPEASVINEEGLPTSMENVSTDAWQCVLDFMQSKRKDRPQNMREALKLLSRWEKSTHGLNLKKTFNRFNKTANRQKKSIIHILPSKIPNIFTLAKQNFSDFARFRYYIGISLNIVFSLYWWIEVLSGGKYDPDWDFHYSLFVQVMIALLYLCAGILEIIRLYGKISALWGLIGCNFLFWFFYMSFLATDSKTGITHMDLGIIPMLIAWITCACFTFYIDKKGRINY